MPAGIRRSASAATMAIICLVAGCAAVPHDDATRIGYAADGAVSGEIVDVASERRYQPAPGSSYLQPSAMRTNAAPVYPPALLDRRLPAAAVVVRIVVGGDGRVESASLLENSAGEPAFADAVLAAVKNWSFAPLLRVTGDKAERLPFSQSYRFVFRQVNGRAVVETAPGA